MSESDVSIPAHSDTHFYDPQEYVKELYNGSYPSRLEEELTEWIKDQIYKLFVGGKYRGKYLLDIGSGPVIYPVITASEWFDEVYVSDLSKANVEYLKKWIRGESEHMEYLMKDFALRDGKGAQWKEKNIQVRNKVKAAIEWDMHKPEALLETTIGGVQFDMVTACLCICAANSSLDEYRDVLKNVRNMLTPGGHFVIGDVMNQTWYAVKDVKFRVLPTTEQEIRTAFTDTGYEIEQFLTVDLGVYPEPASCNAKSGYFIVAKKL